MFTINIRSIKCSLRNQMSILRSTVLSFAGLCFLLQVRNFNHYRVVHRRKHNEARTYLNSDVCIDSVTRARLGTFNLCEKASHIVDENPSSAAFYDILNDWHPCGHDRCAGAGDWLIANMHWFVLVLMSIGMMIYFKWVDHQRDVLFTRMRLPLAAAQHVD